MQLSTKRRTENSSRRFIRFGATSKPFVDPELEDVLDNNLPEPFTKENFYVFLKKQYAEESLEFFDKVQRLEILLKDNKKKTTEKRNVEIETLFKEIIEGYVKTDAARVINISGGARNEALKKAASLNMSQDLELDLTMFDSAVGEIKRLLGDPFETFVKKVKHQNISDKVANQRICYGLANILLGVLMIAGFKIADANLDTKVLFSPFWSLLALPVYFVGSFYLLSGTKKFCPRLCTLNKYMGFEDYTLEEVWHGRVKGKLKHVVETESLIRFFQSRAKKTWAQIILLTIILQVVSVLAPPGIFYDV